MNPSILSLSKFALSLGCAISVILLTAASSFAADAEAGAKVFKKCRACHAVGEGAKHKVGPFLNDIMGRNAGSIEGFKYSKAMLEAGTGGIVWDEKNLDAFLAKPKKFIPKTKMAYVGLKKQKDRDNVIAYLATFSAKVEDEAKDKENTSKAASAQKTEVAAAEPEIDNSPPEFTDAFLEDQVNIDAGKEMWFGQCTHCHGFKAYPGKAPKLKPRKYKPTFVYKRTFKGFKKMPAWKEVFSKQEIMQIVSYVKSNQFSP